MNPIKIKDLAEAITLLTDDHVLVLTNTENGPRWTISPGHEVAAIVARLLLQRPELVAQADGLFSDTTQSWRWDSTQTHHVRSVRVRDVEITQEHPSGKELANG